jgi:hypothetical protein
MLVNESIFHGDRFNEESIEHRSTILTNIVDKMEPKNHRVELTETVLEDHYNHAIDFDDFAKEYTFLEGL